MPEHEKEGTVPQETTEPKLDHAPGETEETHDPGRQVEELQQQTTLPALKQGTDTKTGFFAPKTGLYGTQIPQHPPKSLLQVKRKMTAPLTPQGQSEERQIPQKAKFFYPRKGFLVPTQTQPNVLKKQFLKQHILQHYESAISKKEGELRETEGRLNWYHDTYGQPVAPIRNWTGEMQNPNPHTYWKTRYCKTIEKKQNLEQEIQQFRDRKRQVEEHFPQLQERNVMKGLSPDETQLAVLVDGELHTMEHHISSTGELLAGDDRTINRTDALIQQNIAKIQQTLKKRELFQQLNANNLLTYLSYQEENTETPFLPQKFSQENIWQEYAKMLHYMEEMKKEYTEGKFPFDVDSIRKMYLTETLRPEVLQDLGRSILEYIIQDTRKGDESDGVWAAIGHGLYTVGTKLQGAAEQTVGLTGIKEADQARNQGNSSVCLEQSADVTHALFRYLATALNVLFTDAMLRHHAAYEAAVVGGKEWTLYGLELFGNGTTTALGGATSLTTVAYHFYRALDAAQKAKGKEAFSQVQAAEGRDSFARLSKQAATQDRIREADSIVTILNTAISSALALSGVGGLLVTGGTVLLGVVVRKLQALWQNKRTKEEILNSPHVLGGIEYDKNLISDAQFDEILREMTGIAGRDGIYTALRIVDSIELHRAMRASTVQPNDVVDQQMRVLGYQDRSKYPNIKLKDLQKRIGYEGDWKQDLRRVTEIEGVDYDTVWTKLVKGISPDYYQEKGALLTQLRREHGLDGEIDGVWQSMVKWITDDDHYYEKKHRFSPKTK